MKEGATVKGSDIHACARTHTQVLGDVGTLPDIYEELELHYSIMQR